MAEKTEKATPKKLRDARKKGQVAKSQDFPSAITFIVSISSVLVFSSHLFKSLGAYLVLMFRRSANPDLDVPNMSMQLVVEMVNVIINCSVPILLGTVIAGVLTGFLVVGPLFAPEAMKPDLKKLNPVDNLKNIFKIKTVFELLKSVFKITGAFLLIWSVMYSSLPELIATTGMPMDAIASVFSSFLLQVVIRVGIFFILVAIADLVFQKRNFAKQMKMEKFEVKQEHKDTEGDPHIKSQRRRISQEIAYQDGPSAVKKARAVITNPVHIAVAVDYQLGVDPAPHVVIMGKGVLAKRIVDLATEYEIPIMRNVELAQTLFEKGEIGNYIPEEAYEAVSEILRWLDDVQEGDETANLELFK